ncbi:MAG TPA: hypothetical protein VG298_08005 [Acidimicrobiales bacterium]|nr:hypothetical protein [Acidimicrobiales bacterium]
MSDDASSEEEPNALRRTLDLFVFAPVGVALTVAEDLPSLIAKGRQRVETEIRNARVVGQFVVTQGQQDLTQRMGKLLHGDPAAAPESDGTTEPAPAAPTPPTPATPAPAAPAAPAPAAPAPAAPKPEPDPADGAIVERALAGYDTLSASQVVRRLESLGPDELRAVHRHEASHRNRRTILNRTNQLLEGGPGGPAQPEADLAAE